MGNGSSLRRRAQTGIAIATVMALAGCAALPRSGPLSSEITAQDEAGLEGLVAPLNADVAARAARPPHGGFPPAFRAAQEIDPAQIGVDDVIDILIWEAQENDLFGGAGGAARLEGVTVDAAGTVFVPYAGPVKAVGSTPAILRDRIRAALEQLTPSPQVDVRLREPRSRILTVQGAVARPGAYTIERSSARLTPLLALAGGSALPPEQTEVIVRRGDARGVVMLEDLYADPANDIAMAPGDIVLINALRERFVVLGAASVQGEITFATRELNLLRAIAAARGLMDFDADPTGVFLFRWETEALANALLAGAQPPGLPSGQGRPIVYQLDLTRPEALFVAQAFQMRDGDAIFVTNAPLTELRKLLQLFSLVVQPAQTSSGLVGPL